MSDIHGDRVERHRDEGVYSSRIERDKKEKEKFSRLSSEEKEKRILSTTFFIYLKKLFDSFSSSKGLIGKTIYQEKITEHLRQLKTLLEELRVKDLSNSADFASQLSNIWSLILEDREQIQILHRKKGSENVLLRELMEAIKNYPQDAEHRLGFYLLQHAGKDWLPFPFIEILEKLHKESKEDRKKSTLIEWIQLIDETIENISSKFFPKPQ